MNNENNYETVSKFDRIRGDLHDVALFTKPTTIKHVTNLTGRAETFVVETGRHEETGD